MKKNRLALLLFAFCILSAPGLKAQYSMGDIDASPVPGMSHDSSTCSSSCGLIYLITIHNSFLGDSVKIVDMASSGLLFGAANTTGDTLWTLTAPVPMYSGMVTDDQITGGAAHFFGPTIKIVSGPDVISSIPNMYALPVSNPCEYGSVSGLVYIDNNGDCTFNTGDVALNGMQINSTASLTGTGPASLTINTYSDVSGAYSMNVRKSWMTGYNVALPPEYYFIFPTTTCFTGAYSYSTVPQTHVDFPLLCTGNLDVECWAGSPGCVRTYHPFYLEPTVANIGCDSASGQMKLVKDSRVAYNASMSTNPATSVSGDTLIWNYTNLTNLTSGAYWNSLLSSIYMTPDSSVGVGDTLCFRVYTNIPSTDIDPSNNDYTICLPVVASYDPNTKESSPAGTGTGGDIPVSTSELTYTIHFQNTGTASAINVSVVDTLGAHLNASSLKILSTSSTMSPEWLAPGVVRFNFNGINLPDSASNEPASHGFVRFSIKLNSGLPAGTRIKNTGYIYFDANPAVVTSTAINTLTLPALTPTTPAPANDVKVYPNPANDEIFVENVQNGKVQIINLTGSIVLDQQTTNGKTAIDVSKLPGGTYVLKTISQGNTTTRKFTKE